MTDADKERFVKLFDVSSNDDDSSDVDGALMSAIRGEEFEKIEEKENIKKFKDNLSSSKEEIGELKTISSVKPKIEENKPEQTVSTPKKPLAEHPLVKQMGKTTEQVKKEEDERVINHIKEAVKESIKSENKSNDVEEADDEKEEDIFENSLKNEEDSSDTNDSGDENIVSSSDENSGDNVKMNSPSTITTDLNNFNWQFDNSSPRFENFYEEKKRLVQRITHGEILPFEAYRDELRKARVDLSVVDYDFKIILEKMKQVQSWRDRVQEISSRVNRQFFLWRRFIELIHGFLAQVAYEKPAEKFRGVIYQHLGDVEEYFGELESIRDSVEGVTKNLDGAFMVLSRQLTMMTGSREIPTIYGNDTKFSEPESAVVKQEFKNVDDKSVDLSMNRKKEQEMRGQYDSVVNDPQNENDSESLKGTSEKGKGGVVVGWKL